MKSKISIISITFLCGFFICDLQAELPADFPEFNITQNGETAPGYLVGSVDSNNDQVGSYSIIMDNSGVPVFYSLTDSFGGLECNGLFSYRTEIPGIKKKYTWYLQDDQFNEVDSYQMGNGYLADNHDFQLLPNGHVLMLCYDTQIVDMSKIVEGGHPAASIVGAVIQELDVNKNVIFQWRSWDHIPILDTYQNVKKSKFGYIHVNSIEFDETDGNILLSCRETSEAIKISRATGEVMWRMGGKNNEFTFLNEHPENAPRYFKLQHDVRRHFDGNLSLFDNGLDKNDDTRPYSRGVEYSLDEVNKTATMVWDYRHDPDIKALTGGNNIRLPNGNHIIRWGGAAKSGDAPMMTEVNPAGQLVYEIWPAQEDVTGGFNRIIWPLSDMTQQVMLTELMESNEYVFNIGEDITGVTLTVEEYAGDGYNEVEVTREPFAPLYPAFMGKAPRVLPVRIEIAESYIDSMTAEIALDAESFGFANTSGQFSYADPTNMTIYHRQNKGSGLFLPLTTDYNPVKKQLRATMTNFGEFIIGFPDIQEIPNPPMVIQPAVQASVNQELPVSFFWTPRGFGRYYQLQIDIDPMFGAPVADETYLSETRYTLDTVDPGTTYYYRVRTVNDGGTSQWTDGSFQTVPPMIEVTTPMDGETLVKGLDYFLLWNDNIEEDVVIEVYKGAENVLTVDTVESSGVYNWEVDLGLEKGIGYSIKISSSTDPALYGVSGSFNINIPEGDINGDGKVDLEDFGILASNYMTVIP